MSEKKKELKITVTIKPFQPSSEHDRRKAEAADHIIKFVYKNLEKKFPAQKLP
jgi:hypothetical protein